MASKHNKPYEMIIHEKYFGTYTMSADHKNRVSIPSNIEKTLVHLNSKDESTNDPEAVILHLKGSEIRCYDENYYKKLEDKVNHSLIYSSRIDLARRILIPSELIERYPLSKSVTVSASKDGSYFTIISSDGWRRK